MTTMLPATETTALTPEQALQRDWATNPRWAGIERSYTSADVVNLRGSLVEEQTLAKNGAARLWRLLHEQTYVRALGALTGNQAVQQVKAGLQAIYLSGWQVAADANLAGHTYPDQSLYPANSVPAVVRRINNAMIRADQIAWANGENRDRPGELIVPIVADAEAGFGAAERVRADEADDHGRCRRRALGRSARFGEEMRAPRRQGAHSHQTARPDSQRRSARGRHHGHRNLDHRAH